jgi:threonine dehydrogenase-like Zn-dependent dehydrogenase
MSDKLAEYRRADAPLPDRHRLWPLYGAGFESMGCDGEPIEVPLPQYGPDALLVRHDAVGQCFSDVKVIRAGQQHPRIYRDMRVDPVVLGHEVTFTVVGVGEDLRDQYQVGDRFIVQADIYVDGVNLAYGYEIQGGLSQYNVIDQRVLNGDDGCYLVPVQPETGYAESALTEPWACVVAAYQLVYRTGLKPDGTVWIIGVNNGRDKPYTISAGFDEASHPEHLLLTNVPVDFAGWLKARAEVLGVAVIEVDTVDALPVEQVDDVVLLGADADVIEAVSPYLADFGVFAIVADEPLARKVEVDVGRIHYNRWLYVGGSDPDVARAYSDVEARSELKPGGRVWFVGAGGPMGRLHLQRALADPQGPGTILCTARSDRRLGYVRDIHQAEAETKGVALTCISQADGAVYEETLKAVAGPGFDDVIIMAQSAGAVAEAAGHVAAGGVINVFAGLARGTMASLDLSDVYLRGVRIIGHSGLTLRSMGLALSRVESGALSPNRLVTAVGSLVAARDGLRAVSDAVFPGKVVIFPQIKDLPLTPLPELEDRLPTVYARLKDGREWTKEAEEEFLRVMLP